jgi:hypothetical protein
VEGVGSGIQPGRRAGSLSAEKRGRLIPTTLLWILLGIGLLAMGTGIRGAFRWRKPWDTIATLWVLLGLMGFLIAVLLFQVPGFFRSP